MKKVIGLSLIFAFLLCYNNSDAQQKYGVIRKSRWYPRKSTNLISLAGYVGNRIGYKVGIIHLRYKYFNYGVGTGIGSNNKSIQLWLPVGLYFPLSSRLGINSWCSLVSSDKDNDENIDYDSYKTPYIGEIALRLDSEVLLSISAGYRFQFGEWKRKMSFTDLRGIVDVGRLDGFFIEVSAGVQSFELNRRTYKTRKIRLPNPSLRIKTKFPDYENSIVGGKEKDLQVTVENEGRGLAEDVELELSLSGASSGELSFAGNYEVGNIEPYSEKTVTIPLKANKDLERTKEANISIKCLEKDGFTASGNVNLPLVPYTVREKFPPILAVDATLKEPSGNMLLDALEKGKIRVTIRNNGRGNAWNLEPVIRIDKSNITKHLTFEIDKPPIRKIVPSGTAKIIIPVSADWDVPSGKATVHIQFKEGNGFDAPPLNFSFGTQRFLEPKLVITDVGIDDSESDNTSGDGDNIIENMETIEVTAIIQNQGQGKAEDVKAKVKVDDKNISYWGPKVFSLGDLERGDFKSVKFCFYINNRYLGSSNLPITIDLTEHYNRYGISGKSLGLQLNKTTLAAKDIDIEGKKHQWQEIPGTPKLTIDIETNIPRTSKTNKNAIAVVIGNRNYTSKDVPPVDFANRDAHLVREYLIKALGYREGNIICKPDASLADFNSIFGTEKNYKGKLFNLVDLSPADVFIYYSGHGVPEPESKKGYFMPVDCDPSLVSLNGYSLDTFYRNLSKMRYKSLTVVIDACFSGSSEAGMLLKNISPVFIQVDNPVTTKKNSVILTSATGTQVSCWYPEKKHSLFTYYFLKALQGNANKNKDRKLTLGEIKSFIDDNVRYMARKLSNRNQTPQISGDMNKVIVRY